MNIFDINYTVITLLNYPISFIELMGTISGMACVYLTAKEKVICWPVGIINIVFFFIMFYQIQLYSDMILQVIFLVMTLYGWWRWTHPDQETSDLKDELKVTVLSVKELTVYISISIVLIFLLGSFMKQVHIYFPTVFPKPAAYPYSDAFTTVFSLAATVLMANKKRECWLFWIAVNTVATIVYFKRGIYLVGIEYIIFWMIATRGYLNWNSIYKLYPAEEIS